MLYGAVLVASYGFIALILDQDVVPQRDAGPLVGVAMHVAALLAVFAAILGGLAPDARAGVPVARAIVTAVAVHLAAPVAGGIMYAIVTAQPVALLVFAGSHLVSPFILCASIVALLFVLALPIMRGLGSRSR